MIKDKKNSFYKKKYGIFTCENQTVLFNLRKKISEISLSHGFSLNSKSFKKVTEAKLNNFTKKMNVELGPLNIDIINSFKKTIKSLCGKKIAIQKRPYIRVNCSHLTGTFSPPHTDFYLAHSPYGFNIWIPMFDVIKKSGIFMYSYSDSQKICQKFKFDKKLDAHIKTIKKNKFKKEFLKPKFYEAAVFSNVNIHGSVVEKKSQPRISINMHFQNSNDMYGEKGTEFHNFAFYNDKTNQYKIIND
jgi:sporadic carbohydrate cluster 2OG-Fe(II) oxygenase